MGNLYVFQDPGSVPHDLSDLSLLNLTRQETGYSDMRGHQLPPSKAGKAQEEVELYLRDRYAHAS